MLTSQTHSPLDFHDLADVKSVNLSVTDLFDDSKSKKITCLCITGAKNHLEGLCQGQDQDQFAVSLAN